MINYKETLPGKLQEIAWISSSQLSTMNAFGFQLSFHERKIDNASVIAAVVSSCTANEPTTW